MQVKKSPEKREKGGLYMPAMVWLLHFLEQPQEEELTVEEFKREIIERAGSYRIGTFLTVDGILKSLKDAGFIRIEEDPARGEYIIVIEGE